MTDVPPNPWKQLKLNKVVINIGVGESGDRLAKAQKVLQMVTQQKPVLTRARSTNRDLGIREGQEIGTKVTLRGQKAVEFLQRALGTRQMQLSEASLDKHGNFAFGIPDYTDFPGFKYDPAIGIFGMDVCVEVARRGGWGVEHRVRAPQPVGKHAWVSPGETKSFLESAFQVKFLE